MSDYGRIYFGTILLEKNRWSQEKVPSYRVSEWAQRIADAGFDGMELWQWHATEADADELAALEASPSPVAIFNSYATLDESGGDDRQYAALLAQRFGAEGVKFNVGSDPDLRDQYIDSLWQWRSMFGDDVALLCECHPGTIIEEPAAAREFFDDAELPDIGVIVHAFNAVDSLGEWLDIFGPAVLHAHLQMREGKDVVRFDRKPDVATKAIGLLQRAGFDGSLTLEFTEGTQAPDENADTLWTNALADLAFLQELLA